MASSDKLPDFSFPMVPSSSTQPTETSTQVAGEPRVSRHRRNNAMSARRHGMLIFTASPTSNPAIPPVPKVPESLRDYRNSLKILTSQPLARSLSDVSSCPTLEADNGPSTPDSLHGFSEELDYFNFKNPPSKIPAPPSLQQQSDSDSSDGDESQDQVDTEDDDDDDEEEFWHCRGLAETSFAALEQPDFDSRQSNISDKVDSSELFASNEDPLECYSDYEHWLQSVANRTQFFADMSKKPGVTSPSFNDYMGIIRYPLLA